MKNDCIIMIRLDSSTRNILIENSEKVGLKLSAYCRMILKEAVAAACSSDGTPSGSAAGDPE